MPRGRRKRGSGDTRTEILDAAAHLFALRGYDGTTLRGVAREARVDSALVFHFFRNKETLFTALLRSRVDPDGIRSLLSRRAEVDPGHGIVEGFVKTWDRAGPESVLVIMLRSAVTNATAARLLRALILEEIVAPAAAPRTGRASRLRLSLIGSQLLGLGLARYIVRLEPLASASASALGKELGPGISALLVERVG